MLRPFVIAATLCALALPARALPITDQWDRTASPPARAIEAPGAAPRATAGTGSRPFDCPVRRWCGCWLAHQFGLTDRALWRARNWARIGTPAAPGCIGCIAVLRRGPTGGHVGIVQGYTDGNPIILSGNHNNAVGVGIYPRARVIAYRWVGS